MSSGIFTSSNTDLDNVFEFYSGGTKVSSTNIFHANGNDLSDVYAPLSQGSATSATNIFTGNSDLASVFAAKGTVSVWDGSLVSATDVSDSRQDGEFPGYSLAEILFFADGTIRRRTASAEFTLGNWSGLVANSSNTVIRFELLSWNGIGGTSGSSTTFSQINATRAFSISSSSGLASCSVRIEIREIGTSAVRTKDITLTAEYTRRGLEP